MDFFHDIVVLPILPMHKHVLTQFPWPLRQRIFLITALNVSSTSSVNVYYTVVFEENVVMRKEFSKLVRQTFLYSMIHKISINLGQYAICHNIAHEYPHRDPLGSHKQMPNGWHHYDSPTCMLYSQCNSHK
ncbi:hypothetical protein T01_10605 [Trichinella spiralis]|uniref:Uncharacterized protein n=1 Tax=Trichinella spiralis TaxID=6334 RepID=A0A0V1B283_TRISP|nr:hypothetical protein T01_10605 [Trichinella spiralis]